ncbi:pilus assembly protein N-terminal domain-containing protein [Microvirga aerilata]|uniref:Pilus assembly protein N-terminal domain-containing protein n=1 Tax=Microvirga aerilata TaxID=670292 RepID=A0A936ZG47_9HYPH|nr:pilus assembly protein N-terminal domain-containing protein [Microvirga aerilata]MBL0406542.1 pilus assembly protein N-terminal domain-containing protein [Microvirga aerilata]
MDAPEDWDRCMPALNSKSVVVSVVLLGLALPSHGAADEVVVGRLSRTDSSRVVEVGREVAINATLDFAQVLKFESPARTIIIGNPAIADGTLSDETTIVLTAKAVGTTNMIVLGEAGREIANFVVSVTANSRQTTTVHQGEAQQVYTCAGTCRPVAQTTNSK